MTLPASEPLPLKLTHDLIANVFNEIYSGELRMITQYSVIRVTLRFLSLIAIATALVMNTKAQTPTPTPSPAPAQTTLPPPAANPADVATMDSTIAALYDVISGPAGKRN